MKTAVLIYYLEQVPPLRAFLAAHDATAVALGADIEHALGEAGIPFYSGEELRTALPVERLAYAERIAQGVFDDGRLAFLSHRSVPFGKAHALGVQEYLAILFYYLDMLQTLASKERPERIVVLGSGRAVYVGDVLADATERIVEDAARLVAAANGIQLSVVRAPGLAARQLQKALFIFKRSVFGSLLSLQNLFVSLTTRPKPLRLLVTDLWRNCEPYLSRLPDAEVVLWERTETGKAGWGNIRKHRMRFMHADAFSRGSHLRTARAEAKKAIAHWDAIKETVVPPVRYAGIDARSIAMSALDLSVRRGAERDIRDIEDLYRMLERLKPHVVLVRASESLQTHFPFLCSVAEALGIPAVEVQHGLLYLGPGSFASHPAAKRMATYGPLSSQEFSNLGLAPERLHPTGSPRFDRYAMPAVPSRSSRIREIAYVTSTLTPGWWIDTYDVRKALGTLSEATKDLPARVRVSLRPDSPYAPFLRSVVAELARSNPRLSVADVPAAALIREADVLVAGFSTVFLEALLAGSVAIYDGTMPMYGAMRSTEGLFATVPVPVALTGEELKARLIELDDPSRREEKRSALKGALATAYRTEGSASEEVAALIRTLAGVGV